MTVNEHRDTLRAAYDFDAPRRDNNVFSGWRAELVDEFLARLEPGASLLELGAGAGQGAVYATSQGYTVTAMDLSPANVVLARERGVDARVGDFTDPFFDALLALVDGSGDPALRWFRQADESVAIQGAPMP